MSNKYKIILGRWRNIGIEKQIHYFTQDNLNESTCFDKTVSTIIPSGILEGSTCFCVSISIEDGNAYELFPVYMIGSSAAEASLLSNLIYPHLFGKIRAVKPCDSKELIFF